MATLTRKRLKNLLGEFSIRDAKDLKEVDYAMQLYRYMLRVDEQEKEPGEQIDNPKKKPVSTAKISKETM